MSGATDQVRTVRWHFVFENISALMSVPRVYSQKQIQPQFVKFPFYRVLDFSHISHFIQTSPHEYQRAILLQPHCLSKRFQSSHMNDSFVVCFLVGFSGSDTISCPYVLNRPGREGTAGIQAVVRFGKSTAGHPQVKNIK